MSSPRPAHRPSAREVMLDAAEAHLSADGTLTLDSAARAAGVTKPGLMYHFSTKEALLAAILERIGERYEQGMLAHVAARYGELPADLASVPVGHRYIAYLDWAGAEPLSPADLVIFADPNLRVALTERWQEQIDCWLHVPAGTPAERRRRLLAVRLMADGLWFDRASGLLETSSDEAAAVHALALELLGGDA